MPQGEAWAGQGRGEAPAVLAGVQTRSPVGPGGRKFRVEELAGFHQRQRDRTAVLCGDRAAGDVAAAQRTIGLTLLKNWRHQGRPGAGHERWGKGLSDIAKWRNTTGDLFWETGVSH